MRKSIVIFGIIMAFILGTLVSAPSVYAPQGEPFMFLQEEVDAINEILMDLLNENRVLHYAQSTPVELEQSEFRILAEWEIVKAAGTNGSPGDYDLVLYDSSVYATTMKNVKIGWYRSDVGGTNVNDWEFFEGITKSTTSFEVDQSFTPDFLLIAKYNFIAFAIENTVNEGDLPVFKDFSGTITIHLPASESLSRLT